ncbi:uncharacterized protein PHALS_00112 [Plasmopara halstedii]|uniref:Uncharacterized protein n=1 Tax=Plasmopara halstedii TaxID=4781 RepID=A0A0P1A5F5_PLAHL|nr:uncharacterized protein PHALS_00112 [Plasmopara halstedii]CEG35781.1 hypothetical protein PHALS_00112 [Plasmopara halstedii]|eukprot:XP_024572150.1 hypothetical protein PHALS_00112 [Plasmopara halstedii]
MAGSNQWLGEFSGGGGRRGEPQPQIRPQSLKPEERADNQAKAENDYDRAGDAKSPLDHVIPLAVSPMDPFGVAERLIPCRQE